MKIAVSGATGLIGSALIKYALSLGDSVVAIVRPNSRNRDNLPDSPDVEIIECDLKDYEHFETDKAADVFFHFAWDKTSLFGRDDIETQEKNIGYSIGAVELASKLKCRAFVGAGSQAEYGVKSEPLTPNTLCNPESGYGIAKFAAGKLTRLRASQLGIRHVWARILSIYGENDAPTTLISYLIDTFEKGGKAELTPCEQTWDYLYADDCARALYLIGKKGKDGKTYPVGSGEAKKLKDFVLAVKEATNNECYLEFGAKKYYPHQPMCLVADISELTKDTGFMPNYSFDEGIRRTVKLKRKKNLKK